MNTSHKGAVGKKMLANGNGATADPSDTPYTETPIPPAHDYDFGMYSQQQEEFLPRLLRAWINERNAPELLPFQFDLVQDTIELVDNQAERLETELSAGTVEMAFVRCLYQIEMDRVKYILQSYFRSRINKIERYCYYLKGLPRDQQVQLMSKSEIEHAKRYRELQEQALKESVLDALPPQLRALPHQDPDTASMLPVPDTCRHVIGRFRRDVAELLIDPVAQTVEQNVERGDLYVLQYGVVKEMVQDGTVELI